MTRVRSSSGPRCPTSTSTRTSAQRSEKEEKKDESFYRSEFRYGSFERTLPLLPGPTLDDVKATYQDGVVEIRIPTSVPASEATKVPVQRL